MILDKLMVRKQLKRFIEEGVEKAKEILEETKLEIMQSSRLTW
jgi:hypothetical protein